MKADATLDVKGKTCPMPVLLVRKKIRTMEPDKILEIIGDFLPAKINIQNFLKKNGHDIIGLEEAQGIYHIFTRIRC